MKFFMDVLRGIVIGIANIIPGVSGGTMAVSMGIYDKIISAVNNLFKSVKKSIVTLLPIVIGTGIGIVALSYVISFLFEHFPVPTYLLFIGLIVGGLPLIARKLKGVKLNFGHILVALIFFAIVVGMPFLGGTNKADIILSVDIISIIKLFFVGVIASATMVIPGVSGSMMLTVMGYYNPVINEIKDFTSGLVQLDKAAILHGVGTLLPMGVGIVVGIFAIAKLISVIFEKCPSYAYMGIIGLIAGSPIAIMYTYIASNGLGEFTVASTLVGIVTLVIGCVIAYNLSGDKKDEEEIQEEK